MLFTKLKIKNLVRHKFVHHQKARHLRAPYTTDEFAEYFEIEILVFLIENYVTLKVEISIKNLNFRALSSKFGILGIADIKNESIEVHMQLHNINQFRFY